MIEWTFLPTIPPIEPRLYRSKSKLVVVQESAINAPMLAVAYCFRSSDKRHEPQWYLDTDFYRIDAPYMMAAQVIAWMDIPELPCLPSLFEQLKLTEAQS